MNNHFKQINFNPYNNNPLDYLENENLVTIDNKKIKIKHDLKFKIYIENELKFESESNIQVCYFLNMLESGIKY